MRANCAASSTSISMTTISVTCRRTRRRWPPRIRCRSFPASRAARVASNSVVSTETTLSKDEILRYSRHLIMPEVGMEGQLKLKNASVLLVGTGGVGGPPALFLPAAGIGRIGIVDFDVVDYTNLQ